MQGNHLVNAHRFLGWALALFLVAGPGFAASLTGRVVAVSDGDTLTVLDADRARHKIRLSGIDAPEKAQAFGERSKKTSLAWSLAERLKCSGINATAIRPTINKHDSRRTIRTGYFFTFPSMINLPVQRTPASSRIFARRAVCLLTSATVARSTT
jgi:hypothetical protein